MTLSIKDRLSIMQMLPETGSICEIMDVMEIAKKIRISQEEKAELNYVEDKGIARWDVSKDLGKEVTFKHEEITLLKAAVKKLDDSKGVTHNNVDICIKINSL